MLPTELWEQIIDELAFNTGDPRDPTDDSKLKSGTTAELAQCTLVCHTWLPRASCRLFTCIYLLYPTAVSTFLEFAKESSRLQTHVTGIVLARLPALPEGRAFLKNTLAAVPGLRQLSILDNTWPQSSLAHSIQFAPQAIDTLQIGTVMHRSTIPLPGYLCSFDHIRHLRLKRVEGSTAGMDGYARRQRVETLHAYGVDPSALLLLAKLMHPQCLRAVHVLRPFYSDPDVLHVLGELLGTCSQSITRLHFDLRFIRDGASVSDVYRVRLIDVLPENSPLAYLRSCPKLQYVCWAIYSQVSFNFYNTSTTAAKLEHRRALLSSAKTSSLASQGPFAYWSLSSEPTPG